MTVEEDKKKKSEDRGRKDKERDGNRIRDGYGCVGLAKKNSIELTVRNPRKSLMNMRSLLYEKR